MADQTAGILGMYTVPDGPSYAELLAFTQTAAAMQPRSRAWQLIDQAKALLARLPSERLTWPDDDGPATTRGDRQWPVYRKPTIYSLHTATNSVIADRADHHIAFAFTEDDDEPVTYDGDISQDTLFRVLLDNGLLTRRAPEVME